VIGWENACVVPWELVEYLMFLSITPSPMNPSSNYDENGEPVDKGGKERLIERCQYSDDVKIVESSRGLILCYHLHSPISNCKTLQGQLKSI
jgi:hypothetical protein